MDYRDNTHRYDANHTRHNAEGSAVIIRKRRGVAISPGVDQARFIPANIQRQTVVATFGVPPRAVSLQVQGRRASHSTQRPLRGQPQARLLTARDRTEIAGQMTPGAHREVGRPVVSPSLMMRGNEQVNW